MKNKLIYGSLAILIIASAVVFLSLKKENIPIEAPSEKAEMSDYEKGRQVTLGKIEKLKIEASQKYDCDDTANVLWTECIIEKLDLASAEREWKQRRIESLTENEFNLDILLPQLDEEQIKIRKWREGFEKARNSECEASHTFVYGSGTPGGIASCELDIELRAINTLNEIYYYSILFFNESKGISNFEPTEKDLEDLVKTNLTKRGCIWVGDECD